VAAEVSPDFGRDYLQRRIAQEFALARHIGVMVDRADDAEVVLRAPLAPNANHKGTAFGGSLYSVAVLAGWAWATRYLAARGFAAEAVIQESNVQFIKPVLGELCARAAAPAEAQIDKFRRMLERAGRGRIHLRVEVTSGPTLAVVLDGSFAAALRP
jgi:thioesterase domain-containing protein